MANKLFMDEIFTTEKITADEIAEYVDTVWNTVLKMKFKSADVNKHIEILKGVGINIRYSESETRINRVVLGSAYCLSTDESYGTIELPNTYIQMSATTDLVKELTNTLIHEVGHLIAGSAHAHDTIWRSVTERIGKQMKKQNQYFGKDWFMSSTNETLAVGNVIWGYVDCYGDINIGTTEFTEKQFIRNCEYHGEQILGYYRVFTPAEYVEKYNELIEICINWKEFN